MGSFIKYLLMCIVFVCIISEGYSYRILIMIPTPSYSHHRFFKPIIKELSLRGHQVVYISPIMINDKSLTNITEINVEDMNTSYFNILNEEGRPTTDKLRATFVPMIYELIDKQLSAPEVKNLLNDPNQHFDLFITETLYYSLYPIAAKFKCPLIGMRSGDIGAFGHYLIGNPINPSYLADVTLPFTYPKTFRQRLYGATRVGFLLVYWYTEFINMCNQLIRKHLGDNTPDVKYIVPDLVISNYHPILSGVRPLVPTFIGVGGLLTQPAPPLPKDLQTLLDEDKNGVIYFSLGTTVNTSLLSDDKKNVILNALAKLPYKVLWKVEKDLPNVPKNVIIRKWFPQTSILVHPNTKVFITQGGAQSMEEAIHSHVPMIAIPFISDQMWNADKIEELGIGISLNFDYLTEDMIIGAVQQIMQPKYKANIKELDSLLQDEPMKPLEKAIWWIEYVIRHNGTLLLRSEATKMNFFSLYLFDMLGLVFGSLIVIILIIYFIIKTCCKYICCRRNKCKKIKQN